MKSFRIICLRQLNHDFAGGDDIVFQVVATALKVAFVGTTPSAFGNPFPARR